MRRARAIIVLSVLLAPLVVLAEDGPDQGDRELARRIREATSRATKALAEAVQKAPPAAPGVGFPVRGFRPMPSPAPASTKPPRAVFEWDTLAALALARAGGPAERKVAEEILDAWWNDETSGNRPVVAALSPNYRFALAVSALEGLALHRIEEPRPTTMTRYEARAIPARIQERLEAATRALISIRSKTASGKGCAWTYLTGVIEPKKLAADPGGSTGERPKDVTQSRPNVFAGTYDNSNTQFSVLALHDASRGGVTIEKDVAVEVAEHFLDCAFERGALTGPSPRPPLKKTETPSGKTLTGSSHPPFDWGYRESMVCCPGGSMTFAGLSSLAIARDLGAKDPRIDAAIARGLAGTGELLKGGPLSFGTRGNWVANGSYWLYSLEKALDLLEVKELDGKDWFAPLARKVLEAQGQDGLWAEDPIDSSLLVLFLTRASVSTTRVVNHRTMTGGASDEGSVYLAKTKSYVNAIEALGRLVDAKAGAVPGAIDRAREAVEAIEGEGHGRDACLLGPMVSLLAGDGQRREFGRTRLKILAGRDLTEKEAGDAAALYEQLRSARDGNEPALLRSSLADLALPLPVRAFAASSLAGLACAKAVPDIVSAADRLADETILDTQAGARCARAYGDALVALVRGKLPELPRSGPVKSSDLHALAREARAVGRKVVSDAADHALEAHAKRGTDDGAWTRARSEVEAAGTAALVRLVEIAEQDASRESRAYALLRTLTGELIPDEAASWRVYLEGK